MLHEPADVLAEDDHGLLLLADADDVGEEGSAGHALVRVGETALLPGDREGLARESRQAYLEVGHVGGIDFGDVSGDRDVTEIRAIGPIRILVPFGDEDGIRVERLLESESDSPDAGEEVDCPESHAHPN